MIRLMNMNVVFLALTVAIAFGNYHVKEEAKREAAALRALEAEIEGQQDKMRMLEAEWSLLNEPERIQALAERHLDLTAVAATQVADVADLGDRLGGAYLEARAGEPNARAKPVAEASVIDSAEIIAASLR